MTIDLAVNRIEGAPGKRVIAFLHGILGRGNNLQAMGRRFVEARPDWSAWLVDLRGHGRSPKGTPEPSLEAAARDVVKLATQAAQPIGAIVGHSFGGKVALETARIGSIASLEHIVVIDSSPGIQQPRGREANPLAVIETIESLPRTFPSRAAFVEALVERGKTRPVAQWLAQSAEKDGDHIRFALNTGEIRALLADYSARDLWPVVEQPPDPASVHLIIGDRSGAYSAAERERAARIAASSARTTVDVLPAGHWVHVDDPDGLLRTLLDRVK